jgi:anaerobic selenocysteine-containing dehydrogenase
MSTAQQPEWKKTACIIRSLNCGLEVQTEGRRITKARGDKSHPVSKGYICEKSQRMDYYQSGDDRLTSPMRRKADNTYEAIGWDQAIPEITARLKAIRDAHGGEAIFYFGGGNQGAHLAGTYAASTLAALGVRYRSNALAQEKTGEAWVQGKMMGSGIHGDFEHAEVAVFVGKNPWQSHGFARTRAILREIENDPDRSLVVIDPRRTETAAMADYHLAVKPGTDAWCLTALAAIIVQDGLQATNWLQGHTTGYAEVADVLWRVPVAEFAQFCGVDEGLLRRTAERIARAKSVSMIEDLGVQMSVHSTLSSYLGRLVWLLTGHFARPGTNNAFVPLRPLGGGREAPKSGEAGQPRPTDPWGRSPVTDSRVIMGLIPCNVIPEEILTDHPKRLRAMIVECANPVHSLADSQKMREAIRALDCSVVIDVAMTETARQADYVLPACSQFEKPEATFFNFEFPRNGFQLRHPLFEPMPGTLPEAEIHARLIEALGEVGEADYSALRQAAAGGFGTYAQAFGAATTRDPRLGKYASVLLYRTLGPTLPPGLAPAASLWGVCQMHVRQQPKTAARAGFEGHPVVAANKLFEAILANPSGVIFSVSEYEESWAAVRRPENRIALHVPEIVAELKKLAGRAAARPRVPLHPVGRGAAQRDEQYVDPQSGLAQKRRVLHLAHSPQGCSGPRLRRWRIRTADDPAWRR